MFKILYLALSTGALGLILFEAPAGSLLTGAPDRGKVSFAKAKPGATGTTTASPGGGVGVGTIALWAFVAGSSGGYQGGK